MNTALQNYNQKVKVKLISDSDKQMLESRLANYLAGVCHLSPQIHYAAASGDTLYHSVLIVTKSVED